MIEIFTTGGTIDKVYFDANSEFEIGDSLIAELLAESNIHDGYTLNGLLRKDSGNHGQGAGDHQNRRQSV